MDDTYVYLPFIVCPHYSTELRVEFSAQRRRFPSNLDTSLTCSAVGGYPPVKTITLYKINVLLTRTSSSGLRYNTQNRITPSQYGKYRCLIDIKITVIENEILLQEEGIGIKIIYLLLRSFKMTFCLTARMTVIFQTEDCSIWAVRTIMLL